MKSFKVHMLGPLSGSGYHRTLCEQYTATGPYSNVLWTENRELVTCGHCRRRIDSATAREEDDAYKPT